MGQIKSPGHGIWVRLMHMILLRSREASRKVPGYLHLGDSKLHISTSTRHCEAPGKGTRYGRSSMKWELRKLGKHKIVLRENKPEFSILHGKKVQK